MEGAPGNSNCIARIGRFDLVHFFQILSRSGWSTAGTKNSHELRAVGLTLSIGVKMTTSNEFR